MKDKFGLPEEPFLLNPNCSELIGAINIKTDQDFKAVIAEMQKLADLQFYIHVGIESSSRAIILRTEKDADGKARLTIEPIEWGQLKSQSRIKGDIPVSADSLCLKEGKLNYDLQKAVILIDEVSFLMERLDWNILLPLESEDFAIDWKQGGKRQDVVITFRNVRLDLGLLLSNNSGFGSHSISLKLEDLVLKYNGRAEHNIFNYSSLEESLYAMISDLDWELFPTLRSIFRLLAKRFDHHIISYDGGTTKSWEKWCAQNFAEYYIDKIGEAPIHENGTFYLLPIEGLNSLRAFLKEISSLGFKVIVLDDHLTELNPDLLEKLALIEGEPFLCQSGKKYPLDIIRLLSTQLDLDQYEDKSARGSLWNYGFKVSIYPCGDNSLNDIDSVNFYIYIHSDHDYWDDAADNLIDYLEINARAIRI